MRFIKTSPQSRNSWRLPAVLAIGALVLSACGGDDAAGDPTESDATATAEQPQDEGGSATAGGGGAQECDDPQTARFTTSYQPNTAIQDQFEWFTDEVAERTDGCLTFEHFYAESLLPSPEMLPGIGTGQAEAGMVIPVYNPDIAPIGGIHMVPLISFNHEAHARALDELAETNELFLEEQEQTGVKYLSCVNVGVQAIGTDEPITAASQLNGVQVRAVGDLSASLTYEPLSMNPVPLPITDIYQSFERGLIDAYWQLAFDALPANGIHEIAPWAYYNPIGVFGTPCIGMNMDFYESLPTWVQETVQTVADESYAAQNAIITDYEEQACDVLIEAGGGATVMTDEAQETWHSNIGDELRETYVEKTVEAGYSREQVEGLLAELEGLNEQYVAEATYEPGILECAERTEVPSE